MKLFYFSVALLFSFITVSFSQTIPVSILKSDIFKDDVGKSTIVLAEKTNDNNFLIVRSYNNNSISLNDGFFIEKYNSDLKLVKDFNFQLSHLNSQKYNLAVSVFTMENNIIIVNTYFDLNRKAYVCEANIIAADFKTSVKELLSFTKEEIKPFGTFSLNDKFYIRANRIWTNDNLGTINSETATSTSESMTNSDIVLVVNKTKTAFAVAIDFSNQKAEDLKLYLFDNKLNKKQEIVFSKDLKDKKSIIQNVQVSDDGKKIYVLTKSYLDELKDKKTGGKYIFELSQITATSEKTQQINPNEHFIGNLKTYFQNDKIICLGFYSDLTDYKYTGISYFDLDATSLNINQAKYNPFSNQFISDKYGDKKPKALENIVFKDIFFNLNGDMTLNAEEEYITITQNAGVNGMGGGGSTVYHFNDIISLQLNSTGELLWARNINKDQSSYIDENTFFISYTSMIKANKTYFFINTTDKIKKLKNDRIEFGQASKNKSNLNIIRLDENGDFDFQEILDDEENEVPFMVSKGALIDNSVYFLGRKGKNKQLLKVTL